MTACAHTPKCPDFAAHRARQLTDWKQARAKHARALRNRRGFTRKTRQYRPGMNIIRREPR